MANVKSKHIFLIFIVSIVAVLAYSCLKFSIMFRPLGERGAVYETVETANNIFKVRMTARYEEDVYMPGAYLIYESASIDSNKWHQFLSYRTDDAIPIPRKTFRFLNERTAYGYLAYDYFVTLDGGHTWKIWKPLFPMSSDKIMYWAIIELIVEADGTGQAKIENYDEQKNARVTLEIITEDFGQSWHIKP